MKNSGWKRLCSLLLALVMALSLTPVHLYAAEREPAAEPTDSDSGFSADYAGEYTLVTGGNEDMGYYTYARVTAAPGEELTLQVQATSDDPDSLTYQWSTGSFDGEMGWYDCSDIEDAVSDTYTVTDLSQRWYRCAVSDSYGNYRELSFYAYVDNALTAECVGEETYNVTAGESVTLQVAASAIDMSGVTYRWCKDWGDDIPGANSDTLVLEPAQRGDYQCHVSDAYGGRRTVYFTVNVDSGFSADYAGEYTLVTDGDEEMGYHTYARVTAAPGEELTLQVQATSDDPDSLTYVWCRGHYYSGEGGWFDSDGEIPGADADTYTVTDLSQRWYRCTVSDRYGNTADLIFCAYVDNQLTVERVGEESYNVAPGESVTLRVAASAIDMSRVTYQWYRNGYEIPGENTDTLVLDQTRSGDYQCEVSDQYGNSQTIYFNVTVENHFTVDFAGDYTEVFDENYGYYYGLYTVPQGTQAELGVTVSGDDTEGVRYNWYTGSYDGERFGIDESDGPTWVSYPASYERSYTCIVTDRYGNSTELYFRVACDDSFTVERIGSENEFVSPGGTAVLMLRAVAGASYQWYRDGQAIPGATAASYTAEQVYANAVYRCRVTKGNLSGLMTFYVKVTNGLQVGPAEYNWEDGDYFGDSDNYVSYYVLYVTLGQSDGPRVVATADDTEGMTYRWYRSWRQDESLRIPGADGDTCPMAALSAGDFCLCVVTDRYGNEYSVCFRVYINNDLSVWSEEDSGVYAPYGGSVTLHVHVSANDMEGLTYRWWSDNRGNIPGATADTFTVENVTGGDWYYCEVRDKYGNTSNTSFFVGVDNGFSVERVGNYEVYVAPGESATLQVNVTANDMEGMTYRWWSDNRGNIPGATGDSCTVENVTGRDWYYCEVTDKYGSSRTIDFYVCVDNHLTVERVGDYEQRVAPGESATLQVIVTADDMDGITYQWYRQSSSNMKDGGDWWWEPIEGATTDTCTVENVTDTREYYCHVHDQYGNSASAWFQVGIENHLRVVPVTPYENLVSPGESVTLQVRVTADDMEGITYRWYEVNNSGMRDGGEWVLIEGADTDTCTIENVRATREYVCEVSDKYVSYANAWFRVGIENHLRVVPVTPYENLVSPGESVTLQVRATADDMEGIAYQWYGWVYHSGPVGLVRDGGSGGWYEPIQGADTDTLTVENVTDTRQYYCQVTDKYGNSINEWFEVGIENHLRVERVTPYENLVSPGESVTLQVRATADDMKGVTYQWRTYRDGYGETDIPGATTDTYTVENVTYAQDYYCEVKDKYGNSELVWFIVKIQNHLSARAVKSTVVAEPGEDAVLQVIAAADDMEDIRYQWYTWIEHYGPVGSVRDGGGQHGWWEEIDGADTDTCLIENVDESTSTSYRCLVTDKYGSTAVVFVSLEVRMKTAAIVSQPQDYTGALNDYATFHVEAEGHGLTYMWQSNASGVWKNTSFATSKTDTLRVKITAVRNGVKYRCVVTDEFGNKATSRGAALYVEEWEPLVLISQPEDYIGPVGEYATFRVEATGMGLTYMWQNDVTGRWTNTSFATSKEPELRVKITEARNGCHYRCVITDELGDMIASQPAALWVEVPQGPIITAQPQDFTGPVGTYAAFHVEATGEGLTYQWQSYTNGKWVNNSLASSKTDTLSVKITAARDGAQYRCVVTDAAGLQAISDPATLHVGVVLAIVGQPEDFTGPIGTYATFRVEATGEGLTYQWQSYTGSKWVNNNFASSKTDTLSVKITAARDGAQYRCVVTDTKGETVISEPATLHVGVVLAIVSQPENFTGAIGEYATFHVEATGEELTYQWQSFSGGKWVNNSFATSKTDTLSVKITAARDGAQYRCVITDAAGQQVISDPAALHVG